MTRRGFGDEDQDHGAVRHMITQRSIRNAARVMKNSAAQKVLDMEARGAGLEELLTVISGQIGRKALFEGDLNEGTVAIGQSVGLIKQVIPVKAVIQEIMHEADAVIQRLQGIRC